MFWWNDAVFYQIYPRSFLDSNGDRIGDLNGIRSKIQYLKWLNIDAVWLSPIYESPMADGGYDVSNYCSIDSAFGTIEEFDLLISELHESGIKLILDWVPNHTSDKHPWFLDAQRSRKSAKRHWYIWRDRPGTDYPNNWQAAFGGPAWTLDESTQQYYLHLFLEAQPDLNWSNPEVATAMHDVLRFWLERGVDGFRADVVHLIGKNEMLLDLDEKRRFDVVGHHDDPAVHDLLRNIRGVIDEYANRMMIGEVNLPISKLQKYTGSNDELNLVFNFALIKVAWSAIEWREVLDETYNAFSDAWPTWVLSNHDNPRHRTRFGGNEARARVAAVILLTLRGTPFLFAGEELGMEDAVVIDRDRIDPGNRDGCRAPLPWDNSIHFGWASSPFLPWSPSSSARNVQQLASDRSSILHLYRELIKVRSTSDALQYGSWQAHALHNDAVCYERTTDSDRRLVIANFSYEAISVDLPDGEWTLDLSSYGGGTSADRPISHLRSSEAIILKYRH